MKGLETTMESLARSVPRPSRRTDLRLHELDGEALIYDAGSADTHRLNGTGYFIWRECDGGSSPEQIARRVTESYDVTLEEALQHVHRILAEFNDRGLLLAADEITSACERAACGGLR